MELIISNHGQAVYHHNHCEDLEISHEDFFHQSDLSDLSEILTHPEKTPLFNISIPLNISCNFWQPPKLD